MPIIGFDCPVCHHLSPLDHYENTECGLVIHPDYAAAAVHSNDDYYGKDVTTVTAGLGCPRSRALEYDTEVFINPLDYNALLIGSAWDKAIEVHAPADLRKVRVEGEIAGITMTGEIDRVRRVGEHLLLEDWKHSNNNAQRFLKKEIAENRAVKTEYRIQTSIYAELYEQQFGERPTKGVIWNHYSGAQSNYNVVLIPLVYETLPLDTCLEFRPYGGDFTVLELYQQADAYHKSEDPNAPFTLPLAGVSMTFGTNTLCDYCQVRKACMTANSGAPF